VRMTRTFAPRAIGHAAQAVGAAALTLLGAMPLWAYFVSDPSVAARAVVAGIAAISVVSPSSGLLACAALFPLAGPVSALSHSEINSAFVEPIILAFLAGSALRLFTSTVRRRGDPHAFPGASISFPVTAAALLALAVAGSAVVGLFAIQPGVDTPAAFAGKAFRFLFTGFFRSRGDFDALVDGAYVLEGVALYVAAIVLGTRDRRLAPRVFAMVACGGAGVAALNIVRLLTVWLRAGGSRSALGAYLRTIRISAAFGDPNACGSYLAMALLLAAGCGLSAWVGREQASGRRVRVLRVLPWIGVAALIVVGLWLTDSRTALAAVVPGAFVLLPALPRLPKRVAWSAAAAFVCVVLVVMPLAWERFSPPESHGRSISRALDFRVETTRAAGRMIAGHPVFGIGVGRFYPESGAYLDEQFRQTVPRENAHNNFLQVLAELGAAGFLPFLALLGVAATRAAREVRSGHRPAPALGAAAGLAAFVLTWLAGHPLLIPDVAASFWIVLGMATAAFGDGQDGPGPSPTPRRRRIAGVAIAAVFALVVVASVPFRGLAAAPRTGLQNTAIGLSAWETGENAVRFRTLERARGRFYVRADSTSLRLPLRLAPDDGQGDPVSVDVSIDGVLISRVQVDGTDWRDVAVVMPRTRASRPFRTVEVAAVGARAEDGRKPRLQLGAPTVAGGR
jgi:hypothetical protein